MKLRLAPDFTLPLQAVTETFGILAVRGAGKSNTAAVADGLASQAMLCRKYGVSPATMSQVVTGKTWKHVEPSL